MRYVAKVFGAGLVGFGFCAAGAPELPAQQTIPNAPTPQTLPQVNSITPTAPATPGAPDSSAGVPATPAPQADASTAAPTPEPTTPPSGADQTANPSGDVARHLNDIVVNVNFVQIPFTVKDSKGQLVPGLQPRDVRVFENGAQQAIRLFTVDPTPLSVAIVIDQSVTFDTMKRINTTLESLQAAFTPYDEVSVFTYNNFVKQQTAFTGAQSARLGFALESSKGAGREPVAMLGGPLAQTTVKNNQAVDPNTNGVNNTTLQQNQAPEREFHPLNDAILQAAQEVTKAGKGRRRVIYVISDGREYGSQAKQKEVIRFLQTNAITVYGTLVGDESVPGVGFLDRLHLPLQMRDDILPRYTTQTGGQCDPEFRPQAIENNFTKLIEQVRTQYTVGYYSHEPFIDSKYRTVDVRVLRPSLTVIAEPGYWPRVNLYPTPVGPASQRGAVDAPTAPGPNTNGSSQQR